MKIAMIGHKRIPSREGGIEIVVEQLAVRMVQKGHQVDVYNRWEPFLHNGAAIPKEYKGIRIFKVPTSAKASFNAVIYSVIATCRAVFGGYDLIHFHAEGPCVMLWLPKIFGIPTVATIHGLDWQRAKWGGFAKKYLLLGERVAAKVADEVIVLSQDMKRYFQQKYQCSAKYICNGVNIPEHKEANVITEKFGLQSGEYILYMGRLVPEKGIHYLLKAFLNVKTDKKLVIAGKIDKKSDYVQKICEEAKKDSRVIMTDFVSGQELEEMFSNCCLYVLPSDVEGMAISLLEALSYGCRCLVSDICENREAAGNFAEYFPKGDCETLRKKLEEMLKEKEYGESAKQIAFAEEHYSWDKVVQETLQLYEEVIHRKGKN